MSRRHQRAVERSWSVAARELRDDLERRLRWFESDLVALRLALATDESPVVALRTVYEELTALEDEFDDVTIDLPRTTIRMTTDSIVLDDLNLGPFALVWNWSRLPDDRALTVEALAPCHPAARDDVPHPHVMDGRLCEGDAARPLAQALRQGRLGDYFLIVRQTLETYNPSSAYVALADWSGVRCRSCDDSAGEEDLTSCECCGDELCLHCSRCCRACGRTGCSDCLQNCSECLDDFCPRCWPSRPGPQDAVCPTCQATADENENEAPDPIEEEPHAEDETPIPSTEPAGPAAPTDDPVHAPRLGKTALAAGPG